MSLSDSIRLALTSLRANKMRSFLTLLGVIIGIASVITILTLGKSLKSSTEKSLAELGVGDLTVQVEARPEPGEEEKPSGGINYEQVEDESSRLKYSDVTDLESRFAGRISGVSIGQGLSGEGDVTVGLNSGSVELNPINADFQPMRSITTSAGRLLTEDDVTGERPVALVNQELVDKFYNGQTDKALGSEIEVETSHGFGSYRIVGVQKPKESNGFGGPARAQIYIPVTLAPQVLPDAATYQSVNVRVAPNMDQDQVRKDLQDWATERYDDNPDYRLTLGDMSKDTEELNKMLNSLSAALAAIAGLSLLVGGIGVMNIMLITVTERTREIGVRKALGATKTYIRTQFVVESMIVCLVGGIIGVIIGSIGGMIGANALDAFVLPPLGGVLLSLLFSLAIGLFFGYYPANKAAKLNPIDALRYE
ncbi:ABC transporter permease [Corynebacterium tapiri]|uniref:FtsX-like permease family protein n=1 Tax=Corynebacterium tapiri TaxID=1448266 RepID=A0A5C4U495_9CORY|nr:ABC transporter permease [Corynebacterium tapiri]TNL98553.1 FtsX-like permease family protein [Corynebacterium tapiri]